MQGAVTAAVQGDLPTQSADMNEMRMHLNPNITPWRLLISQGLLAVQLSMHGFQAALAQYQLYNPFRAWILSANMIKNKSRIAINENIQEFGIRSLPVLSGCLAGHQDIYNGIF